MADELNITVAAYSNIERGKAEVTVSRLYRIADILGVQITDLLSSRNMVMEKSPEVYGFATKTDVENLKDLIRQYQQELNLIRKDLLLIKKQTVVTKVKKKKN